MRLEAGAKLGRYDLVGVIGTGGMGEVYRARDLRLGRQVAIKILPSSVARDGERLARFQREARTVGALNHPNVLTVHDVGSVDGFPYLVTELLDGETLRARLDLGPLSVANAIDFGKQIARGVGAAHERAIVHRDLKPENIFITRDHLIKILDFGVATGGGDQHQTTITETAIAPAASTSAASDVELAGTVAYMSPEQLQGDIVDYRSDVFAIGAVLYELLTGRHPFRRATRTDTIDAILTADVDWRTKQAIPAALRQVVDRCLEKDADDRFQCLRDLEFALDTLSVQTRTMRPALLRWLPRGAAAAAVLAVVALPFAYVAGERRPRATQPTYQRLTFRRGNHGYARFAPDGRTIVYGAWWDGGPGRLFTTRLDEADSHGLDAPAADVLSISASGQMAVLLNPTNSTPANRVGTLALMPIGGGAARELAEHVQGADWSPDGRSLAVIREIDGHRRLEYPLGHALYSADYIFSPRVSPRGDRIAFIEAAASSNSPLQRPGIPPRAVRTVDLDGRTETLAVAAPNTLAWRRDGSEIVFADTALRAVNLAGRTRLLAVFPEPTWGHVQDLSAEGRLLIVLADFRTGMMQVGQGAARERDVSWLGYSDAAALSADGSRLLFTEGDAYIAPLATYIRSLTDSAAAVKLGDGRALALSPDGRWALTQAAPASTPVLYPTGPGDPRAWHPHGLEFLGAARWLPDGERLLVVGRAHGRPPRLFVVSVDGSEAHPITPEGISNLGVVSPDSRDVALRDPEGRVRLVSVDGGAYRAAPGEPERGELTGWSADKRSLFVTERDEPTLRIFKRDVVTGSRVLWKTVMPADPAGVYQMLPLIGSRGEPIIYTYRRFVSNLYSVTGLN